MQSDNKAVMLPNLCGEGECTGCGACEQACPTSAIKMTADKKGFLYPSVSADACIGCKKCENSCPVKRPDERRNTNEPYSVIACWHKDKTTRDVSSSGGAMSTIAQYVLGQGGVVWGAAWDNNMHLKCQSAENAEDLDKLRRSKYVQSEIGDAYKEIKRQLADGRAVLFVGTPCQVRGLYAFIGKSDVSNLLTVDFICHGVPSQKVFGRYIKWIESKFGERVVNFNFRDKRFGSENYSAHTVAVFEKSGEKVLAYENNSYMHSFINSLFMRPCCHRCVSNGIMRDSDFTIADFWGIGRHEKFAHVAEKSRGISLVSTNSAKAEDLFWKHMAQTMHTEKRSLEEASRGNWNYSHSSHGNAMSDSFWEVFCNSERWEQTMQFMQPTFAEKCKIFIITHFGSSFANKLRKILGR